TLPDAPTNITPWAARSTDDHNKELALELPGPVIGDLPDAERIAVRGWPSGVSERGQRDY
ncbi:hypothetical protein, partial [Gordonia sp. i37]|uniref:hypothetical protein n=1 Tax=Gordonia sp. i37 TaxID=1961707 RepID=UPI001C0D240D